MPYAKVSLDVTQPYSEDAAAPSTLRDQAVAIDPPPAGAIGIEELLGRFENFAETTSLTTPPENGPVGVRELLARLDILAGNGQVTPQDDEEQGES